MTHPTPKRPLRWGESVTCGHNPQPHRFIPSCRNPRRVAASPDEFRCICDPTDVFDPAEDGQTPLAVEGCPAHRARRVYQQWAIREGLIEGRRPDATAGAG